MSSELRLPLKLPRYGNRNQPAGLPPSSDATVPAAKASRHEEIRRATSGATPDRAINVFALACARLYDEIAGEDPQPWKKHFAAVTQDGAAYRLKKHNIRSATVGR